MSTHAGSQIRLRERIYGATGTGSGGSDGNFPTAATSGTRTASPASSAEGMAGERRTESAAGRALPSERAWRREFVQQPAKHVLTVQSHDLGYDKEDLDLWSFALSADEMKQLDAAQL